MTTADNTIIAKFYIDQGIAALGISTDTSATRYALGGIAVQQYTGEDGNKYVRFMSSDGRRGSLISYPHDPEWCFVENKGEAVVVKKDIMCHLSAAERKAITTYPRFKKTSRLWVRLTVYSKNGCVLREYGFDDTVVFSCQHIDKTIEGRFPNLVACFQSGSKAITDFVYISVDAEFLMDSCKQVLAMNQASDPTNKTPSKGVVLAIDRSHMKDNGDAMSIMSHGALRIASDGLNRNMCSIIMPLSSDDSDTVSKESPLDHFTRSESYKFCKRIAENPAINSEEAKNVARGKVAKTDKPAATEPVKAAKTVKSKSVPAPAPEPVVEQQPVPAAETPAIDPPVTISTEPPVAADPVPQEPEVFPDGYLYTDAPEEFDNPGTSTVQVVGCDDLNNGKLVRLVKIENANDHRWIGQIERYSGAGGGRFYVADTEEKFAKMTRPNGGWKLAEEAVAA